MKRGNNIIVYPIIMCICIICITFIGLYIIQCINPFIEYQKLNNIANKYMYIIERFGYLTNKEKDNMLLEIKNEGIILENLQIEYPSNIYNYGTEVELVFRYKIFIDKKEDIFSKVFNRKETTIVITKSSFSKI